MTTFIRISLTVAFIGCWKQDTVAALRINEKATARQIQLNLAEHDFLVQEHAAAVANLHTLESDLRDVRTSRQTCNCTHLKQMSVVCDTIFAAADCTRGGVRQALNHGAALASKLDALKNLCRQLERENSALQGKLRQLRDEIVEKTPPNAPRRPRSIPAERPPSVDPPSRLPVRQCQGDFGDGLEAMYRRVYGEAPGE